MADTAGAGRDWPLAGRAGEIAAIEAGWRSPDQYGVLLTGAWGVGKSRVAQEAAARLERNGCRVVRVGARRALRAIPFGAITQLGPGTGDGRALLSRLTVEFRGPARTVLVVDDVQFLDDESDAVLAQLMTSCPVFLIGTVGSRGGGVPEATAALWHEGRIAALPIRPLPADATAWLVDRLSGADVIGRHRLARLSGGNPLALRALLDAGAAPAGGFARGPYERWLEDAGPGARRTVEFVACAEPVPMSLLETLVDPPGIEAAERAGLVHVDTGWAGPAAGLAPPLSGPVARLLLTASTVRRVYGELAAALLGNPIIDSEQVLRAGEWQIRGGTVIAPDRLLPAAREAMVRHDVDLAVTLAEAARDHCPGPAADVFLAHALFRDGQARLASAALPARRPDDPELAAAWAVTTARVRYFGLGEPADRAERVGDGHAEAEAGRSWIQLADGRCEMALSTSRSVLSRPDAGPPARILASAAGAAAAGLLGRGALSETLAGYGVAAARGLAGERLTWGAVQAGYAAWLARLLHGDLRGAQELADRGYGESIAAEVRPMAAIWAGLRGITASVQGRVRSAARSLREAVELSEGTGAYCLKCSWMTELAAVVAIAGDGDEADRWLARSGNRGHCHASLLAIRVALSRAWSHAAGGEFSLAVQSCLVAAEAAGGAGMLAVEAGALYDAARLGAADAVHHRLADLTRTVDSEVVAVMAMAARALAGRDPHALGRATDAFERLGHVLPAAETAVAAVHAHRRAGQQKHAALLQERAESLAQRCEGARTPLPDQGRLPAQLTSREREVMLLAPSLTSPQIAARLGLSPRTVSNYLQSAYDKLGLTGRAELRVLLGAGRGITADGR